MLILTRKKSQSIVIGDQLITITVTKVGNDLVKLGIDAPRTLSVHRKEVFDHIQAGNDPVVNDNNNNQKEQKKIRIKRWKRAINREER